MGLFDSLYVPCPHCERPVEFQSKALPEPYMNQFTLKDAPSDILWDVMNWPEYCKHCGQWLALIDPAYPPNAEKPRPNLRAAKVRAPADPRSHPQGMNWWPAERFTYDDLSEPLPSGETDGDGR